jgi:hypothetical protein
MEIHNQWQRWIHDMDKKMKYDVCLYHMKHVHTNQLDMGQAVDSTLGKLDLLFYHIEYYNGKTIGNDGVQHIIRDEYASFITPDSADMFGNIKSFIYKHLDQHRSIRVGFYTKNTYNQKQHYYLLSTSYSEDPSLYVKMTKMLSDDPETKLYYMIRYNIDETLYYALSGMTKEDNLINTFGVSVCPRENDIVDEIRFYSEYLSGVDIDYLYEKAKTCVNTDHFTRFKTSFESGLSCHVFDILMNYPQFFKK